MAFYKMQELSGIGSDEQRRSYPRMTGGRVVSTDELAERVCDGSTFNPGEVKGMLASLCQYMAWELRNGNRVKIEGIGTFSASLGLTEGTAPETPDGSTKRNAQSIRVRGVNYRPDKDFVTKLNRGLHLERSPYKPSRSSSHYTPEERLARALEYLDSHPFLTVRDYCALTGLCATPARTELRQWAAHHEETGIDIAGRGSHRVYVKTVIND